MRPQVVAIACLMTVLSGCTGLASTTPSLTTATSSPTSVQSTATPTPGTTGPGSSPATAPAGSTAWEQALQDVPPGGTRSLQSALRLFAIAFGPLPGLEAPSDHRLVGSATVAVRAIGAHRDELTPEQLAAVDAYLAPTPGALRIMIDPIAAESPAPAARPALYLSEVPGPDVGNAIASAARGFRATFASKLGSDVPGPIYVDLTGKADPNLGYAVANWNGAGYADCTIEITGLATDGEPAEILNTVAHEVFHCFEARDYKSKLDWDASPDWIQEGGAKWAAAEVAPSYAEDVGWWTDWLELPQLPLFSRTYDAIGFWAHLAESGTSPWSTFRAVFQAGLDQPAAFVASGAGAPQFLDSWASGLLRQPARGAAWDTTGVGIPDDAAPTSNVSLGNGDAQDVVEMAYANILYSLEIHADVLTVALLGRGRLSDGQIDVSGDALVSTAFCTKSGGCGSTCPNGSPFPEQLTPLGPLAVLAVTGGQNGVSGELRGISLDTFCKPPPTPDTRAVHLLLDETGLRIDAVSCTGPFGSWNGLLRWGSIPGSDTGYLPDPQHPYLDMPIAWTISGTTGHATVTGTKTIGRVDWIATFDLTFTVDPAGDKVSVTGSDTVTMGGAPTVAPLSYTDVPIEPASAGSCP